MRPRAAVDGLKATAYRVPTDAPESDGTFAWRETTLVVAEVSAGGAEGLGYTYADAATARFIESHLKDAVLGLDAMDVSRAWEAMIRAIRNMGRPGVASMAVAAVDIALWDLKARLLERSLAGLLGAVRDAVPAYGSGGFTSYSIEGLQRQLSGWTSAGMRWVKMKIGTRPGDDLARVRAAREAIGPGPGLFVDANGAYGRKEAAAFADAFRALGVAWFEEPVSSDDLEGLRLLRDRAPAGMDIAAGEYGYDLPYFRRMLAYGAIDVLQADATRCAGITEFLRVAALCSAAGVPLSAHCAPSLHQHLCCAVAPARHVEYFHDHARIETMLFEGAARPESGLLRPDLGRPGLGLELRSKEAERYVVR